MSLIDRELIAQQVYSDQNTKKESLTQSKIVNIFSEVE